jgi:hypothetical protein
MLPPTDSLHLQNLKLSGFIASTRAAQAPPPAYSATTPTTPPPNEDQLAEDDDDYDYPSTQPAPITINIDNSLTVQGHANTIVLPSTSSPASLPSPTSLPAGTQTCAHPNPHTGRVERITGMVLTALKDAGLLDSAPDMDGQMMSRPVDIHVNAGIILKGSRNTVCTGMPKLVKSATAGAAVRSTAKARVEVEVEGEDHHGVVVDGSNKRRASSVGALLHHRCLSHSQFELRIFSRSLPRWGCRRELVALESLASYHCRRPLSLGTIVIVRLSVRRCRTAGSLFWLASQVELR